MKIERLLSESTSKFWPLGLLKKIIWLVFLSACSSGAMVYPTGSVRPFLLKETLYPNSITLSQWELGKHEIYQIPKSNNLSESIQKTSFFYFNAKHGLDSVNSVKTGVVLTNDQLAELDALVAQSIQLEQEITKLTARVEDVLLVAGGTTIRIQQARGKKTLVVGNLCERADFYQDYPNVAAKYCTLSRNVVRVIALVAGPEQALGFSCAC